MVWYFPPVSKLIILIVESTLVIFLDVTIALSESHFPIILSSMPVLHDVTAKQIITKAILCDFTICLPLTSMYVALRAWRANEGGTTDLPDHSEIVPHYETLFES